MIDIIGLLSVALRDEDFAYDSDGMLDFYDGFEKVKFNYDGFEKVELNIDVDVIKLKETWKLLYG